MPSALLAMSVDAHRVNHSQGKGPLLAGLFRGQLEIVGKRKQRNGPQLSSRMGVSLGA